MYMEMEQKDESLKKEKYCCTQIVLL